MSRRVRRLPLLLHLIAAILAGNDCAADEGPPPAVQSLRSPGGTIEVEVTVEGPLTYTVRVGSQTLLGSSKLGLRLRDGTTFGPNVELVNATKQSVDETWEDPFGQQRVVRDQHNQLHLLLRERSAGGRTFEVLFRVFDDGVAFRYELLSQPGVREFVLEQELTEFAFADNYTCYAGEQEKGFIGPQEWPFARRRLSDIKPTSIIGLPLLIETPRSWVAIAEADLRDWAGMWLSAVTDEPDTNPAPPITSVDNSAAIAQPQPNETPAAAATAAPPPVPTGVTLVAKLAPRTDGEGLVKASTPHRSAWRAIMIGRSPGRLVESELIKNLSAPSQLKDTAWIKPGMMAWDHWWTRESAMTTDAIKQYIQLAADMGWPYQLIDLRWYGEPDREDADITKAVDTLNLEEIRRFSAERNVRLWLWLHWKDADRNDAFKKAFAQYKQWGIAGVKIDFMDRDDQEMVKWYEKVTRAAAENELMINFHGAMKPTGFERTFPNQITREGVLGNEYNKWSAQVTPDHKVTLPFTRYLLGPGDFTPGGFLNRQPSQFGAQSPTLVQGTRAAELALLLVYHSPIVCMCDHPEHYRDAPGADFLKAVPTVWDDTQVLQESVGEHIVVARKRGDDWYLGALTGSEGRDLEVKLDFLGESRWEMRLWRDAEDASQHADHLIAEERTVSADDTLSVRLAPAGGFVARFQRP